MNIFVLDYDITLCARYHCDKHVVKMVLEYAQLLCSPYENGIAPYRRVSYNHPCAKWVRQSQGNYEWLLKLAFKLEEEYTYRYGKIHKSLDVINWCARNYDTIRFVESEKTEFVMVMPEEYKTDDVVESYRNYYKYGKINIIKYTRRKYPKWLYK